MSKAVYSAQNNPLVYTVKCTIVGTAERGANGSSPERQEPSQAKGAFAEAVGRGGAGAFGDDPGSATDSWHFTTSIEEGEMQYFT